MSAKIEVVGLGEHTLTLVKRTCELMQQDAYTDVWVVFDRDSFPAERFNAAIAWARQRGIEVAYSNEAFELWYLLHFHYHDAATARSRYTEMLNARLGRPYRKNDPSMYRILEAHQPDAIRNATRLLSWYGDAHNPEKDNPSTTVHLLVQALKRHAR